VKIDPKILSLAAKQFGVELPKLHPLGGMEGMALEYRLGNQHYVLKVTPGGGDNPNLIEQIKARIKFISYLSDNGVALAKPIQSPVGNWVERIDTREGNYLVTASTKACGQHISLHNHKQSTPRLFQSWGRVVGQMHRLAKDYPSWEKIPINGNGNSLIMDWTDEYNHFKKWCQDEDIREKWCSLGDHLETLPRDRNGYGLIHNDLHPRNFLVDHEGVISVIDFDVCAHHFFIKDIAIALFFANWHGKSPVGSKDNYLTSFFQNFMQGYSLENELDDLWFFELPSFVRHHQILLYIVFTDEWKNPNKWELNTLARWKRQILNDIPVVNLRF